MTYETVRDILEHIRDFHRRMRDELEEARADTEDERTNFVLEATRRDEQAMNLALGQYENTGDRSALGTWIQYVPDEETVRLLQETEFPPDMSPEELVSRKVEIDQALADMYERLAGQSSAPRVIELFERLAEQTSQRLTEESWQIRDSESAPKGP